MRLLILVSLIWGLSFGLVKAVSHLDAYFLSAVRLAIALPMFLPFLSLEGMRPRVTIGLIAIGALQYGLMYVFLFQSYAFLNAYEIALFTIFTPIYISILSDLLERRFRPAFLGSALLSIAGAAVIVVHQRDWHVAWTGFLLVQVSNFCFAAGQIAYRCLRPHFGERSDRSVFALLYIGGFAITAVATSLVGDWSALTRLSLRDIGTLLYLGMIASALCFFWWNKGATMVNSGTLAAMNNLKIPAAIVFAVVFFGEQPDYPRLVIGSLLVVLALLLAERAAGKAMITTRSSPAA